MLTTTFSDLSRYEQCKRHWYLGSYLELRPELTPMTGALPFGIRIHAALEAEGDGTVSDAVSAYRQLMDHDFAVAAETGLDTEDLSKEAKLGQIMLEGFAEWEDESGFYDEYEVVSVETKMSDHLDITDMDTGEIVKVLIRGKADQHIRRKSDGVTFIRDFKTAATFSERDLRTLIMSAQPRLYLMLQEAEHPDQVAAGVVFTLLRKVQRTARAKPPFYMNLTLPITPVDKDAYRRRLTGAVSDVARTTRLLDSGADPDTVARFTTGWWCGTCPFKAPCEMMQTYPEGARQMLDETFVRYDHLERYADTATDTEVPQS